jgi:hypothetical protein
MHKDAIDNWNDFETWNKDHTVMVSWEWLDEGECGDYDPDDPEDYPHLRFSVYKKGFSASDHLNPNPVEAIDDSSYCTLMPIDTPKETLIKLAEYILNCVEDDVKNGNSIKKCCERLSWIDEGVLDSPE